MTSISRHSLSHASGRTEIKPNSRVQQAAHLSSRRRSALRLDKKKGRGISPAGQKVIVNLLSGPVVFRLEPSGCVVPHGVFIGDCLAHERVLLVGVIIEREAIVKPVE